MYGVAKLRQAAVIGNTKKNNDTDVPADQIAKGVRQFGLAVSRSTAASNEANIVCGNATQPDVDMSCVIDDERACVLMHTLQAIFFTIL
jgi:hypothetical protein